VAFLGTHGWRPGNILYELRGGPTALSKLRRRTASADHFRIPHRLPPLLLHAIEMMNRTGAAS